MAEVDTSSYPRPTAPPSLLDVAQKVGGLQTQQLGIQQQKLDQANQALGYMTRAMGSLGPNATKEQYIGAAQTAARMGLVPPETVQIFAQRAQASPSSQAFYNEFMTAAADHQQQINYHLGQPGETNTGQTITPTVTSVKPGFGVRPTGLPVQIQTPPGATVMGPDNVPTTVGAQPPQLAPGSVAGPTPLGLPAQRPPAAIPGPIASPSIVGPSANFGGTVTGAQIGPTTTPNQAVADRFPQPRGFAAGTPPNFEAGQKALAEDQANATNKMTAAKPAILALKLLPGLKTGPGTEPYNKAVAFLKAQGVIPTGKENDPTVVYQEADKYLHQYLKGRGGRSDADLAAAEKSSPGVGIQLNPALQHLTQSAIAQDRIEAARPTAFTGAGRKDFQNYGEHRATFPQSIDERAFQLDLMPKEDSQKLVDQMHNKYKANPKNPEALKFFNSLDLATKQGFFTGNE